MKFENLFHIMLIIFLTFYGCGQNEKKNDPETGMLIRLTADSTAVELYNIPGYVVEEFLADSLNESLWTNFFAVYEETSDPELRDLQPALEGSYEIRDRRVQFYPAGGFRKGILYFARCYTKNLLQQPQDLISSRKLFSSEGFIEFKFRIAHGRKP